MKLILICFVIFTISNFVQCEEEVKKKKSDNSGPPEGYDQSYDKFLSKHFADAPKKHLDKYQEYKDTHSDESDDEYQDDDDDHDDDEEGDSNSKKKQDDDEHDTFGVDHDWFYDQNHDEYERIKALSAKQVHELQKNPKNCKHVEKDGMNCATCEDPDTGDTSESCTYLSQPKEKKLAYLSKKSHNTKKKPKPVEVDDGATSAGEEEAEEDEEKPIYPPPKGKPLKTVTSESEDADYGAYKLAGHNDDVDDYESAPKFAQLKAEPKSQQQQQQKKTNLKAKKSNHATPITEHDFEIIPRTEFKSRNLNQALTDFKTKNWEKCDKIMKGDMTCYACKDHKGAKQEECMFIQESNPKSFKVEHREARDYDENSRRKKPTTTTEASVKLPKSHETVKKEKFARIRMGRPLMPTKAPKVTAEPLYTPNPLNPVNYDHSFMENKKAIKRTINIKRKIRKSSPSIIPDINDSDETTKATSFVSYVEHLQD